MRCALLVHATMRGSGELESNRDQRSRNATPAASVGPLGAIVGAALVSIIAGGRSTCDGPKSGHLNVSDVVIDAFEKSCDLLAVIKGSGGPRSAIVAAQVAVLQKNHSMSFSLLTTGSCPSNSRSWHNPPAPYDLPPKSAGSVAGASTSIRVLEPPTACVKPYRPAQLSQPGTFALCSLNGWTADGSQAAESPTRGPGPRGYAARGRNRRSAHEFRRVERIRPRFLSLKP
jgi:hypothetical protein